MTVPEDREFQGLRRKASEATKSLETFSTPYGVTIVEMFSDEVTSLCPITNQPDFETVLIIYSPRILCLESKSLKLYFQALRNEGAFIEDLASSIAHDVAEVLRPRWIKVEAVQKPRGGISIKAVAYLMEAIEEGAPYVPMVML